MKLFTDPASMTSPNRRLCRALFVAIAGLGALQSADAASLTQTNFAYDGRALGLPDGEKPPEVDARWNPEYSAAHKEGENPGFHVWFFGNGAGCPPRASNGPTVPLPAGLAADAVAMAGVAPDPDRADLSWTPAPGAEGCQDGAGLNPGPAFVVANEQLGQGIGLFTQVGPGGPIAGPHFWRQFEKSGQGSSGANGFIEGTFVTWNFDWRNRNTVIPWPTLDARGAGEGPKVLFRTVQSVTRALVDPCPPDEKPSQVKQQYAISFINPECLRTASRKILCQVRFQLQITTVRAGNFRWDQAGWANRAILDLDPAQSGLPVFFGPLKAAGQATDTGIPGLDLWRSRGAETAHGTFSNRTFETGISMRQFHTALRVIAGRVLSRDPRNIQPGDLAEIFGGAWDQPGAWLIANVNAAQEVFSEHMRCEAEIGGAVRHLEVLAVER